MSRNKCITLDIDKLTLNTPIIHKSQILYHYNIIKYLFMCGFDEKKKKNSLTVSISVVILPYD